MALRDADPLLSKSTKLVETYARWLVRHIWLVILLSTGTAIVLGYGATFLQINPDSRALFGKDNPQRIALERMEKIYTRANNVIFILRSRSGDIFNRETLGVIEEITKRGWRWPYATRVESLSNYLRTTSRDDELIVRPLYENPAKMSDAELGALRRQTLSDKELVGNLISPDAEVTAIAISVVLPKDRRAAILKIAAYTKSMAAEMRREHPGIEFRLSGSIMADVAFKEAGRRDLAVLIPIMFGVIVLFLWLGYRSVTATIASLLVVIFSVVSAIGIAGWIGWNIDTATAGTPVIIMTLCIADCVHLMTTYNQLRAKGVFRTEAVVESLRLNFAAVVVTTVTTAIGFLTLNFSESPPLRQLGNIVAIGMVAGLLFSITFFPAILSLRIFQGRGRVTAGEALLRRLGHAVVGRRKIVVAVMVPLIAVSCAGIWKLQLEDNFVTYFDHSFSFRQDADFLQNRLTGLHVVQFSLPSGKDQGVAEPDYLRKVDAFAAWARKQPKVAYVSALPDLIKRLNRTLNNDDPKFERIPESRQVAAQLLLFYEMSLPFGRDLKRDINIRKSSSLVSIRLRHASSRDIRRFAASAEAWLEKNAPALKATGTGLTVVYAHIADRNIHSMITGTIVALVLISLLLLIVLRNLRIGLLSLVPNLVPAGVAFGLWGYLVGEVNLAAAVVGAITLGIVVDDTVHLLLKYRRARTEYGLGPEEAAVHIFPVVGSAVMLTSVALVGGFAVLATSGFAISSHMGLLSAITIAVALIADLLLLPALLVMIDRDKAKQAVVTAPGAKD